MKVCVVCRNPLVAKTFDSEGWEVKILCSNPDLKSLIYGHYETPQQVLDDTPDLVVFTSPGFGLLGSKFKEAGIRVLNSSPFHDTLAGSKGRQTISHRTELDRSTYVHLPSSREDVPRFVSSILSQELKDGKGWWMQGRWWDVDTIIQKAESFSGWAQAETQHVTQFQGGQLAEWGGFNYISTDFKAETFNLTRIFSGKKFSTPAFLTKNVYGKGDACILTSSGEAYADLWEVVEKRLAAMSYVSGPISLKCLVYVDDSRIVPYAICSSTSECFWPALRQYVENHFKRHDEPQDWMKFIQSLAKGVTFYPLVEGNCTYVSAVQSLPASTVGMCDPVGEVAANELTTQSDYPYTVRNCKAGELNDFQNPGNQLIYNFARSSVLRIPGIFDIVGIKKSEQTKENQTPCQHQELTQEDPLPESSLTTLSESVSISKLSRLRSRRAPSPQAAAIALPPQTEPIAT